MAVVLVLATSSMLYCHCCHEYIEANQWDY